MNWLKKFWKKSKTLPAEDPNASTVPKATFMSQALEEIRKRNSPATPYDSFTSRAQQVLVLARKEADRLNHNFIGTEHLFLGLLALGGQGVAFGVLQRHGLELETARQEIEKLVGTGPEKAVGDIPLTPRLRKVLGFAIEEAKSRNHTYVGTEHLLFGLLREGNGVAARVLKKFKMDLAQMQREIREELDPGSPGGNPQNESEK